MSRLPGEQNGYAVLKGCVYSNKWNMPGNYPGHWCQLNTECKGPILLSQEVCLQTNYTCGGNGPWYVLTPEPCLGISYMAQTNLGLSCLIFHMPYAMLDAWEDQWRWWVSSGFTSAGSWGTKLWLRDPTSYMAIWQHMLMVKLSHPCCCCCHSYLP